MTAEEYIKEFTRERITKKDLEKYADKNIAVTGRVTMFSTEKNGYAPPYVFLGAPGLEHGITCYLDLDNFNLEGVRMDKIVTVRGVQEKFPVPGRSPALNRCIVLKAD